MKTKAKDFILVEGRKMTLDEAIIGGWVKLREIDNYPHKHSRFIARASDCFWDIGEKLYASRTNCRKCGKKVEECRQSYAIPTCFGCLPPPDNLWPTYRSQKACLTFSACSQMTGHASRTWNACAGRLPTLARSANGRASPIASPTGPACCAARTAIRIPA